MVDILKVWRQIENSTPQIGPPQQEQQQEEEQQHLWNQYLIQK